MCIWVGRERERYCEVGEIAEVAVRVMMIDGVVELSDAV